MLVVALVGLGGCSLGEATSIPVEKVTADDVFVQFYGSAQMHSTQASAAGAYASFEWQELDRCPIVSGNIVDSSKCVDHLSGGGAASSVNYLGSCSASYTAPKTSVGTTEGVRILNVGSQVEAIGAGPWSLARASGMSGPGCPQNPNGDPTGRLLDRLANTTDLTCVMKPNTSCEHLAKVPPSGSPAISQTGGVVFRAWRKTKIELRSVTDPEFEDEWGWLDDLWDDLEWLPLAADGIEAILQGKDPNVPDSVTTEPAPATGNVTVNADYNGQQLVQLQGTAQQGSTTLNLTPQWNQSTARAIGGISTSGIPLDVTISYAAPGGPPFTLTQTVYLTSPSGGGTTGGPAPTITGVAFHGTPSNPTIVVTGQNLGSEPAASPSGHPSGQGGCPVAAGDQGYDYGTSLYIAFPANNWSAGRYNPALNETDCIDVVVTKFTATEVDFTLGGLYSQQTKNQLTAGLSYQVAVNGATVSGVAAYS